MAKLYAKAPDGSDALLSIVITGFTQSLQQNGWCKLPNGLLIQWRENCSGSWGIAFTSAIWAVGQADTSAWGHTTNTNVQFNTGSIWTTDGYNGPCIAVGV